METQIINIIENKKNSCSRNCTSDDVRWLLNGVKGDEEITEEMVAEYAEEYDRIDESE
jgi:hypothetical protein